jgi:3-methyladenine DNA glycosylase AlkC
MKPLKDQFFNIEVYQKLTSVTKRVYSKIDEEAFYLAITNNYQSLELMERLKQCTFAFHQYLPQEYPKALCLILQIASEFKGFVGMIFPDFVAAYGLKDYKISMQALAELTVYSSSEFAIRPFLREYPKETVEQMENWSLHENEHIRRLASEGLRPVLPWSFKLTEDLDYPKVSERILSQLNNDESLYVRKSVGNHLNDLTKKDSDFVISLIHSWDNSQKYTAWIIKKGLRTLIKNGDKRVFEFLGYPKPTGIKIDNLKIGNAEINIGSETRFTFQIENLSNQDLPILIDYIVHYVKKSGTTNPKVFKLRETKISANETFNVSKKIAFKQLSTRIHYSGCHEIEIVVNGVIKAKTSFQLNEIKD